MNAVFISLFVASFTTFVLIYLLRPFAVSIGLVDRPNNRKPHKGSVPLIGGIAMYIGVVVGILVSSYDLNQYKFFILASFIIVIVGILDDHLNISVTLRLLFQGLVALIITTAGGITIETFGNFLGSGEIFLNEWSYFITVIAIITGINAVNMADGIHGLAGGNSLITLLAIIYLSIGVSSHAIFLLVLLLCAVLPVFLIHNLCLGISESKRIFMGDAGSMFIGLVIASLLVDLSQGEDRAFAPVTALWLFAVPLIEMTTAVLRRLTLGKSPFKPDIDHTHHLLLRIGFGEKNTLLLILFISLLMAVIGILGEIYNVAEWAMFVGFIIAILIYIFTYGRIAKIINENSN
jgi:UDP-GlcNAc:undecaprenyl-phosphate/decaprenyl-phosphate GlcNAc-1-phosphate transferase